MDAACLGAILVADELCDVVVSAEMKSRREVLEEEQVLRGAESLRLSVRRALRDDALPVVPTAVKALGGGLLWMIEYSMDFPPLTAMSERVYRLEPPVPGVE